MMCCSSGAGTKSTGPLKYVELLAWCIVVFSTPRAVASLGSRQSALVHGKRVQRSLHVCLLTADIPYGRHQGGTATAYRLLARALLDGTAASGVGKVTLLAITRNTTE